MEFPDLVTTPLSTNADVAIASSAARTFASHNVFDNNLACRTEYVQRGGFACNTFINSLTCDLVTLDVDGNVACDDEACEPTPSCSAPYLL